MDENIALIAVAPFYGMAVVCSWYAVQFLAHKTQKFDESATQTQMSETVSPSSTQQK